MFVPLAGNKFQRREVEIGERSGGWVEVKAGLTVGESVVIDGVFYLKSELLLEAED